MPSLADIERLRGALAVVRIAGRGTFEITLLPDDAPATVARFAALARSGYYNGLTIHRVVPAFIVQGGSPGANEFVGDGPFMRDEIGLEPHVRGAASISTRGRDTGDAQIWFNLVDNPGLTTTTPCSGAWPPAPACWIASSNATSSKASRLWTGVAGADGGGCWRSIITYLFAR